MLETIRDDMSWCLCELLIWQKKKFSLHICTDAQWTQGSGNTCKAKGIGSGLADGSTHLTTCFFNNSVPKNNFEVKSWEKTSTQARGEEEHDNSWDVMLQIL